MHKNDSSRQMTLPGAAILGVAIGAAALGAFAIGTLAMGGWLLAGPGSSVLRSRNFRWPG
jgi:hypothetical protein